MPLTESRAAEKLLKVRFGEQNYLQFADTRHRKMIELKPFQRHSERCAVFLTRSTSQ